MQKLMARPSLPARAEIIYTVGAETELQAWERGTGNEGGAEEFLVTMVEARHELLGTDGEHRGGLGGGLGKRRGHEHAPHSNASMSKKHENHRL